MTLAGIKHYTVRLISPIIGYSLPCTLDNSPGRPLSYKLLLAVTLSLAVGYVHLPQLLIEALFVRAVDVLGHHYRHLLAHIECCFGYRWDTKVHLRIN